MADGGLPLLPTSQPPPVVPPASPVPLPVPPVQLIVPPVQPIPTHPIQPTHMPYLNWLHFKAEFAGKPDEDMEAHPLRTNNWMDTHAFPEGVKFSISV